MQYIFSDQYFIKFQGNAHKHKLIKGLRSNLKDTVGVVQ